MKPSLLYSCVTSCHVLNIYWSCFPIMSLLLSFMFIHFLFVWFFSKICLILSQEEKTVFLAPTVSKLHLCTICRDPLMQFLCKYQEILRGSICGWKISLKIKEGTALKQSALCDHCSTKHSSKYFSFKNKFTLVTIKL